MSKECPDCGNERMMTCPNCDNRTATEMDASRINQAAASGGEKSPMQVIDELRARITELEAERDGWKRLADKRHDLLLGLEWSTPSTDEDEAYCPSCMVLDGEQHVPECPIAMAIAGSARAANDARAGKEDGQ